MATHSHSSYLTGQLLLAMPGMGDPRFHHAAIFIVSHHALGAMGLVINSPVEDFSFAQLMVEAGLGDVKIFRQNVALLNGGPVETQHGFLLHTSDFVHENTIKVNERFSVSANLDVLQAFATGECPREGLLVLGYAGWGAGQLEQELQENVWLVMDADHDLLFNTPLDQRWDRAYARMGIDPRLMSSEVGRA
ncbi:MAG: YqgE/AlgH family protein [Alphaproteobacteria bacterium]|nr:YqgE/AlgH family protein [Alphaproteobacteria bacterium]MCB9985528.1 YqgE/AlgH family protein [Micavibrio sp.]